MSFNLRKHLSHLANKIEHWDDLLLPEYLGSPQAVREALDNGAKINALDAERRNPLHLASRGDVIRKLMALGCSPLHQDIRGDTALHAAARLGRLEVVKSIVVHRGGAQSLFIRNKNGETPADLAHACNHSETLKYIEGLRMGHMMGDVFNADPEFGPYTPDAAKPEAETEQGISPDV